MSKTNRQPVIAVHDLDMEQRPVAWQPTGSELLRYLSISSNLDPDVCEYPDSKKLGVWAGEFAYITRSNSPVDYWDGE
jgi:uncharacterized cupin superfamily protein